ncbi:MAG TPA: response regulator [Longimicrobiaceae bacterium]|nr:response regulator [Longimicrobiaceae bacterium]
MILIAEDHPDSREALKVLLEASGYEVALAEDGQEAIERARMLHPDLIVMDIMMPNLDGFEATRRLRKIDEFRQTPILALTALEGAQSRVMEAGCNACVTKPIDIRRFLEIINRWLSRPQPNGI